MKKEIILGIIIAICLFATYILMDVEAAVPTTDYIYYDDFEDDTVDSLPNEDWYMESYIVLESGNVSALVKTSPRRWQFYKQYVGNSQSYRWNLTENCIYMTEGVVFSYCNMNVNIPDRGNGNLQIEFYNYTGVLCTGLKWDLFDVMKRTNSTGSYVTIPGTTYLEGNYMDWNLTFDWDLGRITIYCNGVNKTFYSMTNNVGNISYIRFARFSPTGINYVHIDNISIGVNATQLCEGCPFAFNFITNWTLVGHPFTQSYSNASGWNTSIPFSYSIARWDPANQTYYDNYTGDPADDFDLIDGIAYFVGVTNNSSQCLDTSNPITTWNITIYPGWNYLAWVNATPTSAGDIGNLFIDVDTVMYWNTTLQDWSAHPVGTALNNFSINQGMGYLIHTGTPQLYNETTGVTVLPPDEPGSPSPGNNTTVLYPCCTNLTWSICYDFTGSTEATYDVYFGTSNPPPKIASNITNNYLNVGCLTNNTYYWQVVAWDAYNLSNTSDLWVFTCSADLFYYCMLIRNEEDFQPYNISAHVNYSYRLFAYFDNYTLQYNITYNGFNATTGDPEGINGTNCFTFNNQPNVLRLMVYTNDDNNFTYYRSRIPTLSSQSIIFWLPDNDTLMTRYIFTLDDRSGFYTPPDVWIRIYIYNQTYDNIGYIHEDYFTIDSTLQAYLLYNHKYYNEVHKDNLVYQNNKYMDASDVTEQTIIIFPYIPGELSYWIDDLAVSASHDVAANEIVFSYLDSLSDTTSATYEIYEFYNGSDSLLYSGSFSSNIFYFSDAVNVSRYHYVFFNLTHGSLGNINITISVFPHRAAPITPEDIEDLFEYFFGESAVFSFFGLAIGAIVYAVLLAVSEYFLHVGIVISGALIGGFQYYTGLTLFNSMIAVLFIVLGLFLALRKREVYI